MYTDFESPAVLRMYSALTQWEVTPAPVALATLVTLEIESTVQVRHYILRWKLEHILFFLQGRYTLDYYVHSYFLCISSERWMF